MSHQGQHIIENRRRAENAMRDIEVVLSEHQKVKQIANFELKTAKKIELNMKKVYSVFDQNDDNLFFYFS